MSDDVALQILEKLDELAKRIDAVEAGAARQQRGSQVSQFCRWGQRDGMWWVGAVGQKIRKGFDHEKTLASKLASEDEAKAFASMCDVAIQFAVDASR
jgi:hypothetical protein